MKKEVNDIDSVSVEFRVENNVVAKLPDDICPGAYFCVRADLPFGSGSTTRPAWFNVCRCGHAVKAGNRSSRFHCPCCGVTMDHMNHALYLRETVEGIPSEFCHIDGEDIVSSYGTAVATAVLNGKTHTDAAGTTYGRDIRLVLDFKRFNLKNVQRPHTSCYAVCASAALATEALESPDPRWKRFGTIAFEVLSMNNNRRVDVNAIRELAFDTSVSVDDAVHILMFRVLDNTRWYAPAVCTTKKHKTWEEEAVDIGFPKWLIPTVPLLPTGDIILPSQEMRGLKRDMQEMVVYLVSHGMATLYSIDQIVIRYHAMQRLGLECSDGDFIMFCMKNIVKYANMRAADFCYVFVDELQNGSLRHRNAVHFLENHCQRSRAAKADADRLAGLAETDPVEYVKAVAEYAPALKQ